VLVVFHNKQPWFISKSELFKRLKTFALQPHKVLRFTLNKTLFLFRLRTAAICICLTTSFTYFLGERHHAVIFCSPGTRVIMEVLTFINIVLSRKNFHFSLRNLYSYISKTCANRVHCTYDLRAHCVRMDHCPMNQNFDLNKSRQNSIIA
jgi:hypothetical protein